ncbi:MAG: single-stranded DNA-binding protein [Proteobacteria bacterium]|nr:single-stranded DNA-binding protein [Pseudomonadota bacterium]MBU1060912.1 single-stranded DNA-binding protein [Pseudomonadota bacterium]
MLDSYLFGLPDRQAATHRDDPQVRYTQNEIPVATFSVATTERWKDSDGNRQERTEWHRVVAWRGLAETCGEHLKKGDKVFIAGKLQTRKWEDQDDITRYSTEIIAGEMEMLGGKQDNAASHADDGVNPPPPEDEIPF